MHDNSWSDSRVAPAHWANSMPVRARHACGSRVHYMRAGKIVLFIYLFLR